MTRGITSKNQLIDVDRIEKICEVINVTVEDLYEAKKHVEEARDKCGERVLKIDGITMYSNFEEVIDFLKKNINNLEIFKNDLSAKAWQVYNEEEEELIAYKNSN